MTIIEKAVATVTAIGAIGGGALWVGQPPYANRQWAEEQIVQVDLRSYERERDSLEDRIGDLNVKHATTKDPEAKAIIKAQADRLQNRLNETRQTIERMRQKK